MNILLLEDECELSDLASAQLRGMGHRVEQASTIAEAERLLEASNPRFHLIIADHRLPDGLGIDFLLTLAREGVMPNAVVVSGVLTVADVALLERWDIPYFRKPVVYSEVVRKLRKPPPVVDAPVYDSAGPTGNEGWDKADLTESARARPRSRLFALLRRWIGRS